MALRVETAGHQAVNGPLHGAHVHAAGQAEIAVDGCTGPALTVRTGDTPRFGVGQAVAIAIRPEHIVAAAEPAAGDNRLRASVSGSSFCGDHHEYTVAVGGHVRTLALPAVRRFAPGTEISLTLPPEAVTVWPLDAAAAHVAASVHQP